MVINIITSVTCQTNIYVCKMICGSSKSCQFAFVTLMHDSVKFVRSKAKIGRISFSFFQKNVKCVVHCCTHKNIKPYVVVVSNYKDI